MAGAPDGYNNYNIILSGRNWNISTIGDIKPIVKYYYVNGERQEQVFFDESYSINGSTITCTNPTSVELVCEVK